jgi:hypothetical protein
VEGPEEKSSGPFSLRAAFAQAVPPCRTIDFALDREGHRLSHYATKEDLERMNQNLRNWVITVGISTTALQFAMQYALFQLYPHAR